MNKKLLAAVCLAAATTLNTAWADDYTSGDGRYEEPNFDMNMTQEEAAAAPGFRDRKRPAIPHLRIIRNREASDLRNVRFLAVKQIEIAAIPAPRHFHIDPVSVRPDRIRHCRLLAVALQQFGDRGLRIDLELPVIVQRNRMTGRRIFLKMIFPFPVHPFRQGIGGGRPFDRFPPGERRIHGADSAPRDDREQQSFYQQLLVWLWKHCAVEWKQSHLVRGKCRRANE